MSKCHRNKTEQKEISNKINAYAYILFSAVIAFSNKTWIWRWCKKKQTKVIPLAFHEFPSIFIFNVSTLPSRALTL